MDGRNEVILKGYLVSPALRETTNGRMHFQGKIAVPYTWVDRETNQPVERSKYIKIAAWGEVAQDMGGLEEGTPLEVFGAYNERQYDGTCKACMAPEKKYWTEVLVGSFTVVEG